ncbi:uncharacterized protein LOC124358682 [Homalodisca vitripennis]|uniref:uncharacterized protein LOC124358682 n=1 Tax=Homalodisca vitripennis TaxID=197043 RepID=UPI001EEA75A5|nr:uncharacterized protein LOC124358682 [Homalodisca vitripennis]KAG8330482.1 hypothetical protein J6590_063161 [Homalodisca vitripennis]
MLVLLLGSVLLLAAKECEAAGLLAYVPCYDFNKVLFHDETYQREKWKPGSRNLHQRGRNDVKIIDQFVKAKGIVYQHVGMVCELTLTHIHIGQYWINDAGSNDYPGEAGILKQSPTHFQFYLRTTRRGHSVEFRIQFYGQFFIKNHSQAKASFTCIVVNKLFNSDGDRPDNGCDFINWPSA